MELPGDSRRHRILLNLIHARNQPAIWPVATKYAAPHGCRKVTNNRDFEKRSILELRNEMDVLGVSSPLLVTFGKDAELIAKRNLGREFRIVRIPHYAIFGSKEAYRALVRERLPVSPKANTVSARLAGS
jgi:hypothetical protein